MRVSGSGGVDIYVKQAGPAVRVLELEAGLLFGLPEGRVVGHLPRLQVPAGLHPATKALVEVQDRSPRTGYDRRTGQVDRTGEFVEWVHQAVELEKDSLLGLRLAIVGGDMGPDGRLHGFGQLRACRMPTPRRLRGHAGIVSTPSSELQMHGLHMHGLRMRRARVRLVLGFGSGVDRLHLHRGIERCRKWIVSIPPETWHQPCDDPDTDETGETSGDYRDLHTS